MVVRETSASGRSRLSGCQRLGLTLELGVDFDDVSWASFFDRKTPDPFGLTPSDWWLQFRTAEMVQQIFEKNLKSKVKLLGSNRLKNIHGGRFGNQKQK